MTTTIINPPANESAADRGMTFVLGIITVIVFGLLFFIYVFPPIRRGLEKFSSNGINVTLPKTIDVKVQQTK